MLPGPCLVVSLFGDVARFVNGEDMRSRSYLHSELSKFPCRPAAAWLPGGIMA